MKQSDNYQGAMNAIKNVARVGLLAGGVAAAGCSSTGVDVRPVDYKTVEKHTTLAGAAGTHTSKFTVNADGQCVSATTDDISGLCIDVSPQGAEALYADIASQQLGRVITAGQVDYADGATREGSPTLMDRQVAALDAEYQAALRDGRPQIRYLGHTEALDAEIAATLIARHVDNFAQNNGANPDFMSRSEFLGAEVNHPANATVTYHAVPVQDRKGNTRYVTASFHVNDSGIIPDALHYSLREEMRKNLADHDGVHVQTVLPLTGSSRVSPDGNYGTARGSVVHVGAIDTGVTVVDTNNDLELRVGAGRPGITRQRVAGAKDVVDYVSSGLIAGLNGGLGVLAGTVDAGRNLYRQWQSTTTNERPIVNTVEGSPLQHLPAGAEEGHVSVGTNADGKIDTIGVMYVTATNGDLVNVGSVNGAGVVHFDLDEKSWRGVIGKELLEIGTILGIREAFDDDGNKRQAGNSNIGGDVLNQQRDGGER